MLINFNDDMSDDEKIKVVQMQETDELLQLLRFL